MLHPFRRLLATALAALTAAAVLAAPPAGTRSGPARPHFVSLAADRVNVRTGPGVRYPIAWVFVRQGLPVEVIAEFELWRRIRDADGAEGWVHRSLLSGRRTVLVLDRVRTFYRAPEDGAVPAFRAEPGVVARLRRCRGDWCEVRVSGLSGWAPRAHLWGVYRDERID